MVARDDEDLDGGLAHVNLSRIVRAVERSGVWRRRERAPGFLCPTKRVWRYLGRTPRFLERSVNSRYCGVPGERAERVSGRRLGARPSLRHSRLAGVVERSGVWRRSARTRLLNGGLAVPVDRTRVIRIARWTSINRLVPLSPVSHGGVWATAN